MSETNPATLFIARLFKSGALLADTDGDGLPDSITGLLVLGAAAALPEQRAAVDLAARLGFETLALHLPLASSDALISLPESRVPVFIGRPGTVSLQCPPELADLLQDLAPGEGVVAIMHRPRQMVLVGGADAEGLATAARAVCSGDQDTSIDASDGHLDLLGDPSIAEIEMMRFAEGQETSGPQDVLSTLEMPPIRSLAELFGPGGLAIDCDGDLLPERPRVAIVLPDDLSYGEAVAVAQVGARLGLETLGLALPLAWSHDDPPPPMAGQVIIAVEPLDSQPTLAGDAGEILLLHPDDGLQVVQVRGGGHVGRTAALDALARLDCWTTDGFPSLGAFEQGLRRLCALVDPGAAQGAILPAIEQLAAALHGHSDVNLALEIEVPAEVAVEAPSVSRCVERWAEKSFHGRPCTVAVRPAEQQLVIDETHRLAWEVDEAWLLLRETVLPALAGMPHDAEWFIDIRLSEPEGRRRALHSTLVEEIRDTGREVRVDQLRVLPAFHQGRAWLMEEVLPRLLALPVGSMVIRVQRFTPARPSLEPPIRWLQDLFGVDELLAGRLALPVAAIGFDLFDGPHTYEIEVFDAAGETLLLGFFDVVHSERPYLKGATGWGNVHPSTGCVRLWVAGECVVSHPLATDPERVWDYVQDRLLPALEREIRTVSSGIPAPQHQPFFSELSIDVWLSEDDESLGLRQERSSPLECLHEDLYFTVLDFCSALMGASQDTPYIPPWMSSDVTNSRSRDARLWTAPGLVVPHVHRRDGGAGEIRVSCTAPASQPVLRWHDGQSEGAQRLLPASDVAFRVIGLEVRGPEQRLVIALDGQDDACERARRIIAGWA
ncbi:MAG: hypothetical protein JWO59_3121, partial [Chloroflexi bacterium]|nr:hypothetical protein [Chloroflexota bacterium]